MTDPLNDFKSWEGEELGPDLDRDPGFAGGLRAPAIHLHYAGAWGMSSARRSGTGEPIPGVYLKVLAGVVGTGPAYHVVEGFVDADVALQWADVLRDCAKRSRKDLKAGRG